MTTTLPSPQLAAYTVVPSGETDLRDFCSVGGAGALTPAGVQAQAPDESIVIVGPGGPVARCSLWCHQGHRPDAIGLIGHYAAEDAESARMLLDEASARLRSRGARRALAPIDGSTWNNYRFVTDAGDEPPFLFEPVHPAAWPRQLMHNGFEPCSRYVSARNDDLGESVEQYGGFLEALRHSAADNGITVRPIEASAAYEELSALYKIVTASFDEAFLYSRITEEEFIDRFAPLTTLAIPELVLVAEDASGVAGFVFAVPDLLQAERGDSIDTIVVKTLAVAPRTRGTGLSVVLVGTCYQNALQLGYGRAIHALMHETNKSSALSSIYARPIRRYALFERDLVRP